MVGASGEEPTKAVREGSEFRLCTSQIAAMGGASHNPHPDVQNNRFTSG
jgi:hypothetical protein